MATASTLTTIRQALGGATGAAGITGLDLMINIPNGDITGMAATTVTAPNILQNTDWGAAHFKGYNIFRPLAATSADYNRPAGNVTSAGVLSHLGGNWSDTTTTSENVELWKGGIRPNVDVTNAINRALYKLFFTTFVPLSDLSDADGDMAATTDTNWTDVGSPTTSAKATTAAYTPYGLRSYHLVGDAANEGTQSATVNVTRAAAVRAFTINSAVTGTASFSIYDVTNSQTLDGSVTVTNDDMEPQLLAIPWTHLSTTTKQVALQMLSTDDASDQYWNGAWVYRLGRRLINLPNYIEEMYQAPRIFQSIPVQANNTDNYVYPALAMEFRPLREGVDYTLISHHPDANPHAVHFLNEDCFTWPLWVEARRPYADLGTLSTETDTTTCPLDQLLPMAKIELIKGSLITRPPFKGDQIIAAQLLLAQQELDSARVSRPVKSAVRAHRYFGGPIGWGT